MPAELLPGVHTLFPVQGSQPFGVLTPGSNLPDDHPGANGARYFTIQRVNGNGANGKNEGVGGGHRHTLEDSDRVKKNTVLRQTLKEDKERKKAAVCVVLILLLFGGNWSRTDPPPKRKLGYVTVNNLSLAIFCLNRRSLLSRNLSFSSLS